MRATLSASRSERLVPAAAGFAVPWDGGDGDDGGDGGGEGEDESGVGAAEVTRELGENTVRLVSWNVNGLRALLKRPAPLVRLLAEERPHVLCLQETKLQESRVEAAAAGLAALAAPLGLSYEAHWHCSGEGGSSGRKGYSGVAVLVDRAATTSDDAITSGGGGGGGGADGAGADGGAVGGADGGAVGAGVGAGAGAGAGASAIHRWPFLTI